GFIIRLGLGCIKWSSNIQHKVCRSSCESKYHALLECLQSVIWNSRLLKEL
ncbi:hypothetical protein ROZALSC1DRAFT_16980, partial [Rozella allomycis CSF55]